MRSSSIILLLAWLRLGAWCAVASADGGKVVFAGGQRDVRMTVFMSPTPLRAGSIDVSVLLQNAAGQPVADAEVTVKLQPTKGLGPTILARATQDAATNKLLQAAVVELPEPGAWEVEINCSAKGGAAHACFTVVAAPPSAPWLNVWPWFSWPAGAVLVFGVHRWLVWRKQNKSNPSPSPSLPRQSSGQHLPERHS